MSIDTVDARAIGEANRLVNLSEVLAQVPGIAVQDRQNYAQDLQISSRGFVNDLGVAGALKRDQDGTVVAAGSRLPGVASSLANVDLVWRDPRSGLFAGVAVRHGGRVYVTDRNSEAAPGHVTGHLRAGIRHRGKGWQADGFVRLDNVTGRRYIGSVIVGEANGRFYEAAPGRTLTVGLNLQASY